MKCEKYLDLIDDLVEGELAKQTAQQVNLHIFSCQECEYHYEALKHEREMYEHYFEIEPSTELWMDFQTKLNNAKANKTVKTSKVFARLFDWNSNIFEYLGLSPALVCAALILIFGLGFGLLNFLLSGRISENDYIAKTELVRHQSPGTNPIETVKDETLNSPGKTESLKDVSLKINKNNDDNKIWKKRIVYSTKAEKLVVKEIKPDKKVLSVGEKESSFSVAQPNEEQIQLLQVRKLESEAAKQIESVELLLRSFRNARFNESGETFDIAYEKQEAERLLKRNEQLMRNAQIYGTFYTKEILSKIEPYLLDISKLKDTSSPEQIRDIKERVKSQSIIASLQAY